MVQETEKGSGDSEPEDKTAHSRSFLKLQKHLDRWGMRAQRLGHLESGAKVMGHMHHVQVDIMRCTVYMLNTHFLYYAPGVSNLEHTNLMET